MLSGLSLWNVAWQELIQTHKNYHGLKIHVSPSTNNDFPHSLFFENTQRLEVLSNFRFEIIIAFCLKENRIETKNVLTNDLTIDFKIRISCPAKFQNHC